MSHGSDGFNPFDKMTFTYDKCFVCGKTLSDDATVEHVYPKWLQEEFGLWNKRLELLNNTCIRYRDMVIPCCTRCNGILNEHIEKPVKNAVAGGYDAMTTLPPKILFQWLNKISYGTLFKQLSLKLNRRDPFSATIYTENNLKKHRMQFLFLQSTIQETEYINNPWSILIFKIRNDGCLNYWAYDNPVFKTSFMRLNDIGIIAHLMDNGYNERMFLESKSMAELLHKELHPIQFAEVCAKFHYKACLMNRTPYYINAFDPEHRIDSITCIEMNGILYDDWDQETYAHVLKSFLSPWNVGIDDIFQPPDQVASYIRNPDGSFVDI